ncbi:MAG: ATP-binding cassette domain-containing protein [Candidatus Amesbacteria bacterium]|nr:ATP-binding cassette domain-containing protein [Candidatus Amesbacteria bacterium]
MIAAQDLTKRFGDVPALEKVTFNIGDGEFLFLTGKSGSGKTTLIRLLLRDLLANSGSLVVNDIDVSKIPSGKLPDYRREIGVVFQDFKLLIDRNVLENVSLPLMFRGVTTPEIESSTKAALEMVDLWDKASLFPAQLSGGETQRVAIARAIVARPKLLLADEPTGNLDPATAKMILKLLREVHTELKTTVIMATHNADLVNHSSLRVITLDKGKLTKDNQKGKYEE